MSKVSYKIIYFVMWFHRIRVHDARTKEQLWTHIIIQIYEGEGEGERENWESNISFET